MWPNLLLQIAQQQYCSRFYRTELRETVLFLLVRVRDSTFFYCTATNILTTYNSVVHYV